MLLCRSGMPMRLAFIQALQVGLHGVLEFTCRVIHVFMYHSPLCLASLHHIGTSKVHVPGRRLLSSPENSICAASKL